MDTQQLSDLFEIQALKGRYFRHMDTEQWDEFRKVFTDDFTLYFENSRFPEATTPTFASPDALISYMKSAHPDKLTVHQGHTPEFRFIDADTVEGVWALFYYVDDPGRGGAWQAYGHYFDRYVRCPDGQWRIAEVHATHLRVNSVPHQPNEARPSVTGYDKQQNLQGVNSSP